jgi:hypothetical protein
MLAVAVSRDMFFIQSAKYSLKMTVQEFRNSYGDGDSDSDS